ncbi:hypothetical protein FA10DRAFT_258040 [Acaromyces ingoldii]|uniref:Yeast cell wall synthesis Kre9/Knh1-like N-terminal domain-containing protein n=1 Tax=Acaromyces ingoldii TaxID=215250 RepID=A0A316YWM0_9BASI|nr:hypothetical protein FA10DRAFT_258040 [Acaromyces ingoldii]PWN93817.1 hypothetical protein FA10DRAFT_258040 [Acaromyces ingoldii]
MTTSSFKFLSLAALVVAAVNAATVITPTSLTACQNANIAWSGAQGKVYLSVLQGKDTSQKPIKTFPEQDGASGSLLWAPVDIKPNTEVTIQINDGSGTPNYSSQVTVMPAVGE